MDEYLRALQRQYERGDISVIPWMKALQRAGLPYHQLLIETWERLLVPNDVVSGITSAEDSQYIYAALELLGAFPIQCTCRQCSWVSHNGFCTCCFTGVCSPHRNGISGPDKVVMTTMGPACRTCNIPNGEGVLPGKCQTNLPDRLWAQPGKLALEIETRSGLNRPGSPLVWTICKGYHYEVPGGDEERTPNDECRGTVRQQILFMMRHADCRIDAGPPEERDEELENWRDMLSELGPGEFPPY